MSAQAQMRAMLDQLMGTSRDAFTVVDHIAWSSTHSLKKYREHRREWVQCIYACLLQSARECQKGPAFAEPKRETLQLEQNSGRNGVWGSVGIRSVRYYSSTNQIQ
ncbi:putative RNA-binding protein Luc7-like 2 isoform X2 [Balaenoptera ricei]|uniref:putative RNA-binding protein Luc7-like 2 isoform X2 n=1 Tax=Balaenoptera ricei TaxID=2746895 RepID=UPI0028BD292F|nr:putative RNA-binding protein Luc7-like 2 isoform X2 [Balaenoptera ricei]